MTERGPEQPVGWAPPAWGPPGEPVDGVGSPAEPQAGAATGPAGWAAPPGYGPPGYGPPGYGPPGYGPPGAGPPSGWGGPPLGPPPPGVVPLRPLGLGELLDGAVGVVRRYPRPTLGLSLAVALLSTGLGLLLLSVLPSGLFSAASTTPRLTDGRLGGAVAGSFATALVTGLAGIILSGVITAVVGKAVLGQPMTTGDAWRAVRPRLGRLVGLALLTGLILVGTLAAGVLLAALSYAVAGGAGLLLGVPVALAGVIAAVYLYVRLSLAAPVLVLEKVGVLVALRRSGVLVRHSFWRVTGVLIVAFLLAAAVGQLVQLPFLLSGGGSLLSRTGNVGLSSLVLVPVGAGVARTLTAPFSSGVKALLYIDRRMRAEGLDVALAAAAAAPRR